MYFVAALGMTQNEVEIKTPFGLNTFDHTKNTGLWVPGFCQEIKSKEELLKMVSELYDAYIKDNPNEKNESV